MTQEIASSVRKKESITGTNQDRASLVYLIRYQEQFGDGLFQICDDCVEETPLQRDQIL